MGKVRTVEQVLSTDISRTPPPKGILRRHSRMGLAGVQQDAPLSLTSKGKQTLRV